MTGPHREVTVVHSTFNQRSDVSLPTGMLLFLFTDIEGSTRLWQSSPEVMQGALTRHDAILHREIQSRGGHVFKTAGDAFYAAFQMPARGLEAALALQMALLVEPWPANTPIRVRVALHAGYAKLRDGDYFGPPLNVVARMLTIARGGQTLLSRVTVDSARGAHLPGTELESHGFYYLKGVEEPVEVVEMGVRGQCAFEPPQDADLVYRVVRVGELWQPVRAIRHNLPAERDAFIGRTEELRSVAGRLDGGVRLLAVLGPGGTGKTRLVRRYGWTRLGDWPGGIYFCDLSEARSLAGICFAVASALDVPLGKEDPVMQLGHAIAGRGHCLVIVDNFEQVLTHATGTIGRWLDQAVDAAFVVTSRERLQLRGEEIFHIEPLSLDKDAIDLFVARARAQRPDFVLNDANRASVVEVVRLLDGLPLAIELAAARVRVLSPVQLVDRLKNRFSLLVGVRGTAARQATLRAAIDWSWELLGPWERGALAQFSVFEGGFNLDAAEAVLDLAPWPEAPSTLDAVQALVDKSLLRTWIPAAQGRYDIDETYFGMYVTIQEYAREKLGSCGPQVEGRVEERHGRYFARFGAEGALEALSRHGGVKRRRALALELDNLVIACHRALLRNDAETAVATYRAAWEVLEMQGPFAFATDLGVLLLAPDGASAPSRAAVLATRALAAQRSGRNEEALIGFNQALTLSREIRDRHREATVLLNLGNLCRECGRMEEARAHLDAALATHRHLGNRRAEGNTLGTLGAVHMEQGRMEEARSNYEAALAIHREVGNRREEGVVLGNLGNLCFEQGQMDGALAHYEAALAIHREVGYRSFEGNVLGNLGALHMQQSRMEESRTHFEAALAISREVGDRRTEGYVLASLGELDRERGRVEEAREHYQAALGIARNLGDRRVEGLTLGYLGVLLINQGQVGEAREALRAGEVLLREVGDPLWLAMLLCTRGRVEVTAGDPGTARAALVEVEAVAATTGAGSDSELGREIAKLREALNEQSRRS